MEAKVENEGHKPNKTEKEAMETVTDDDDRTTEPLSVDTSETETVSVEGDGISIKSQDLSVLSKKPSSGDSTPSDKRSESPVPSASKPAPSSGGSRSSRGTQDGMQSPEMHPNRPNRPGISWVINGKLEAMDFQRKWYSARIVDMDDTDNTALIHFDGWNQRYDEWVAMDSERLRPLTRTSGRKDKKMTKKSSAKLEHKVGDNVFAKWTDCRMYAGTVVAITPNGSYEVLFYDGFKKIVQPINVRPMPLNVQKEYAVAGILPHPSSRPHQKLQMLEKKTMSDDYKRALKQTKFAKKAPRAGSQSADETSFSSHKVSSSTSSPESPNPHVIKSAKLRLNKLKRCHKHKALEDRTPLKKAKLVVGGKFQVKKIKSHVGHFDVKERRMRIKTSEAIEEKKAERRQHVLNVKPRRHFKGSANSGGTKRRAHKLAKRLFPKSDLDPDEAAAKTDQAEQGTVIRSSQVDDVETSLGSPTNHNIRKDEEASDDDITLAQLIKSTQVTSTSSQEKTLSTSSAATPAANKSAKCIKLTTLSTNQEQEPSQIGPPKKAFQATPEQKFTCPFENCNKSFRKTSLVEYHVKYYHTEDGNVVQPQPPRKRRKTSSICSSDSEVSFPLKQVKKRKENSLPVIQSSDTTVDTPDVTSTDEVIKQEIVHEPAVVPAEPNQKDTTATDYSDITHDVNADCLSKDEVVNCICRLNEENGLMIQCEMCLCWQHAVCMELTEETLPAKYICYICSNPPGIRDSARYSYDQDWLKQGTMARFNFLPADPHFKQKAEIMLATHSLVSDLHGVKKVLSSLKCQLHASKDKNHPEVKFWTERWDKVMEEKEMSQQLTHARPQQAVVYSHVAGPKKTGLLTEDTAIKANTGHSTSEMGTGENQNLLECKMKENISKENLVIKEEVSKQESLIEQGDGEVKSSTKKDVSEGYSQVQQDTASTMSEIKQEPTNDQMDWHKSEILADEAKIKQEAFSDVCSESATEESVSKLKQVPSQEQTIHDKEQLLSMQSDSVLKEGESAAGTDQLISLPENTSSSSLSSLNEEKTTTQSLANEISDASRPVVTMQEEPFVSCEHNLLEHVYFMQNNIESRLGLIEEQISVLEKADDNGTGGSPPDGDILRDVPRVKKAMHQILNDLFKVKRMSLYR